MIGSFVGEGGRFLRVFEGDKYDFKIMATTKMNVQRRMEYES